MDVWQSNDDASKASDRPFGDLGVYIGYILSKFTYDLLDIVFWSNFAKDLKLDILDVWWLVILDEKLFVFILKILMATP